MPPSHAPRIAPRAGSRSHSAAAPFDILQWLPEPVRDAFESLSVRRRYAAGQTIYQQGDEGRRMFRVIDGSVRLSVMRADGREVLYLLFEPGDCFGVSSCVDDGPRPHTAEAGIDTEIQILDGAHVAAMRRQHPEFGDALLRLLSRHMRLVSGLFADATLDTLPARVASRIVATTRAFGINTEGGVRLSVKLSQSEIALMVGASRQSVNKVLQSFQDEGLLRLDQGKLLILNERGLSVCAGISEFQPRSVI